MTGGKGGTIQGPQSTQGRELGGFFKDEKNSSSRVTVPKKKGEAEES